MGIATFRLAKEREAALKAASSLPKLKKTKKPTKSKTNGNIIS
jgi:hypothetical protein